MSGLLRFKSEVKPWSSGAQIDFTNFVEPRGPRGGRVVIEGFSLHVQMLATVATAAIQGEDFPRFFRTITVQQKDGVRRYNEITGDAMRIYGFTANGPDKQKEHADSAVSAGQTLRACLYVPMAKRYAYERKDFRLPADVLDKVKIACSTDADLALGTSVVTHTSGTYWVIAECREVMDVVEYSVDEVIQREFDSATQTKLNTDGRLHDLLLFVRGAEGGASLANLTEAWVEHLMPQSLLVVPDLQDWYARSRNNVPGAGAVQGGNVRSDPFLGTGTGPAIRAVAVLLSDESKAYEGPVRDDVLIKTTQGGALPGTLIAIARIIKPRGERLAAAQRKKYRYKSTRPKTSSKSRGTPIAAELAAFLPAKAVVG